MEEDFNNDEISKRMSDLENRINVIYAENQAILGEARSLIDVIEKEISTERNRQQEIEKEINELKGEVTELETEKEEKLSELKKERKEEVESIKQQISYYKNIMEGYTARRDFGAAFQNSESELRTLNNKLETINLNYDENSQKIANEYDNKINIKKESITSKKDEFKNLKDRIEELQKRKTSLQDKYHIKNIDETDNILDYYFSEDDVIINNDRPGKDSNEPIVKGPEIDKLKEDIKTRLSGIKTIDELKQFISSIDSKLVKNFNWDENVEFTEEQKKLRDEIRELVQKKLDELERNKPEASARPERREAEQPTAPARPARREAEQPTAPARPARREAEQPTAPARPARREAEQPTVPARPARREAEQPTAPARPARREAEQPTAPAEPESKAEETTDIKNIILTEYVDESEHKKISINGEEPSEVNRKLDKETKDQMDKICQEILKIKGKMSIIKRIAFNRLQRKIDPAIVNAVKEKVMPDLEKWNEYIKKLGDLKNVSFAMEVGDAEIREKGENAQKAKENAIKKYIEIMKKYVQAISDRDQNKLPFEITYDCSGKMSASEFNEVNRYMNAAKKAGAIINGERGFFGFLKKKVDQNKAMPQGQATPNNPQPLNDDLEERREQPTRGHRKIERREGDTIFVPKVAPQTAQHSNDDLEERRKQPTRGHRKRKGTLEYTEGGPESEVIYSDSYREPSDD